MAYKWYIKKYVINVFFLLRVECSRMACEENVALSVEANESDLQKKYKQVIYILNACNIQCNAMADLDGLLVDRQVCLNNEKYNQLKKDEFANLKNHFSSSYLTALQEPALSKQKWPLLNLIRQILRSCNYKLVPKRVADGYTLTGDKKYIRMFVIEKMRL